MQNKIFATRLLAVGLASFAVGVGFATASAVRASTVHPVSGHRSILATHKAVRKNHKRVTVNSLGITPLRVKTSNGSMALAPADWTMSASDRGAVDIKSPDGASYAGWGVVAINRQMESYYGKMYGAPEDSMQAIMSQALTSTGEDGDVEYTSDPEQMGYFMVRDWETSTKSGTIFYHIYGDPNSQYEESFYVCYTDQAKWKKMSRMLMNVALSIRSHVVLHPAPGGGYHYTAGGHGGNADSDNPLKDYNAQLGTQWYHDDNGNNFYVDPATATTDGPDGEGVYKVNGNDITKLHHGFS